MCTNTYDVKRCPCPLIFLQNVMASCRRTVCDRFASCLPAVAGRRNEIVNKQAFTESYSRIQDHNIAAMDYNICARFGIFLLVFYTNVYILDAVEGKIRIYSTCTMDILNTNREERRFYEHLFYQPNSTC